MTDRRARRPRRWLLPLGALLVGLAAILMAGLTWPLAMMLLTGIAGTVAVWAIVRLRAERAEYRAELARWDAAQAVFAERLRIARDLHDIVSHGLGMITVRAAAVAHLNTRAPDERALLAAIEDVEALSRQATVELRRMLETLREDDDPAALHPTDTLACLPEIIAGARHAGMRVAVRQDELGQVSPGAQAGICAVVREGLANSARHAGLAHVEVSLARTPTVVTVTVTDDGPSAGWVASPGARHGLIGLRERVSGLGGTLAAGPHPDRPGAGSGGRAGFRLQATIPDAAT